MAKKKKLAKYREDETPFVVHVSTGLVKSQDITRKVLSKRLFKLFDKRSELFGTSWFVPLGRI